MHTSGHPMSTAVAPAVAPEERGAEGSLRAYVGRVVCVAVPLLVWFAPIDIDARSKHVFAIAAFMILAWMTEVVDYALAGFIGCYLYWALGVVPFGEIGRASCRERVLNALVAF